MKKKNSFEFRVSSFEFKSQSTARKFKLETLFLRLTRNRKLETRDCAAETRNSKLRTREAGFTLIEAVVVIAVTGIIAGVVAFFIRTPVQGYIDAARRAELTDAADTALHRVGADLRNALPNSIRVSSVGGVNYLEYLEVRTGARYRSRTSGAATTTACPDGAGTNPDQDVLAIGVADTCFKTLGDVPDLALITTGDFIVVYNLGPGFTNADAYESGAATGGNKSQVSAISDGTNEDRITITSHTFNLESPGSRFQVISGPVTYACDPSAGTLTRFWGYGIATAQPTPPGGGSSAVLAQNIGDCTFTYDPNSVGGRAGIVTVALTITRDGESVNLLDQIHVTNVP